MIRVLNKIVETRLIVLSLILSVLIGIVDGSIAIILTNISFDDAQISMGKKEVIAFIARYILLLFLTNIFSNYLSKIQLSIDTKVHTKFENASHDQLMQYTSNISANVVYVGLVALFTLIADFCMITVLIIILVKTSLASSVILFICIVSILVPVGLYLFTKSKIASKSKATTEQNKLKHVRFVKDNWYSLAISAPSKVITEKIYDAFRAWAEANSSVLFYGRTLRFTFESALLVAGMIGFFVISFLNITIPPEFIIVIAVTGIKALPLTFRVGKSIMLIINMSVYVSQLREILGAEPKRRFYSEDYLQNIVRQLEHGRINVIRGKSGTGKTTLITELGIFLKKRGESVAFSEQFPTIIDQNLMNDSQYFNLSHQQVTVTAAKLGINVLNESKGPYSGGQLKRIGIALTLAQPQTGYIILDEPDSGLSNEDLISLWEVLDQKSKTTFVLCVTHKNDLRDIDHEIQIK